MLENSEMDQLNQHENKSPSALYVCYQSMMDPLTRTQVVAYLEGLAGAGYGVFLLTYEKDLSDKTLIEKTRKELESKNIKWFYLKYHKRPSVPATLYDVAMGIRLGRKLIRKYQINLVHARAHIAGLVALGLKKLTGCKLLFDIRGLIAEEAADVGSWKKDGLIYRTVKKLEHRLVRESDGMIVLTQKAKDLFHSWYPNEIQDKPFLIIPCCVDHRQHTSELKNHSEKPKDHRFVYVGKLGGWYLTEDMVEFMSRVFSEIPESRWNIWTQSDPAQIRPLLEQHGIEKNVQDGYLPSDQLKGELENSSVGLSFIKPCFSKIASSPTKIGEYLASGIPVISTPGIGDVDELLTRNREKGELPVGVIYSPEDRKSFENCIVELKNLLQDEATPQRCREVARKELDLETVGWVRYREMYENLIGPAIQ